MSDHTCPQCQRGTLRRSERRGLWERQILPLFNLYPWRCGFCRARVKLSDRGPERHYVQPHHITRESGEHRL